VGVLRGRLPSTKHLFTKERAMNTVASRPITSFSTPSPLLRRALFADAILTGFSGFFLLFTAVPLSTLLALPPALLMGAAAIFIPFAILVGWLSSRPRVYRPLVLAAIALNALWAVDSVLLLFTKWVQPTPSGYFFIVVQAVVVAVMAELEFIGLRRSTWVESYARL
jgi:hypothetical protein